MSDPPDGVITPLKRLVKMGNAGAMVSLAWATLNGDDGVERDPTKAFELYHAAARAGSSKACWWLANRYLRADCIVKRDLEKAKRLFSRGTRLDDPMSLFVLGEICFYNGVTQEERIEYWKYYVASASMGCDVALDMVRKDYVGVRIRKEDYARTLRAHQAAHKETESESRKKFEERLAAKETLDDK